MRFFKELYQWTFKRLPRRFSIPLLVFATLFFLYGFRLLVNSVDHSLNLFLAKLVNPNFVSIIEPPLFGVSTLLCAIAGMLVSYWLAVFVYRLWRARKLKRLTIHAPVPPAPPAHATDDAHNPLARYNSIGIILAGGGAKGAYQAGAMKAVYEFLEKYDAHRKVRMIAGTSIGSWNALFWLANLIKAPTGDDGQPLRGKDGKPVPGLLEQWWKMVDVQSVIRPAAYIPMRRNHFLSSQPWEESFETLFGKDNQAAQQELLSHLQKKGAGAMHFYFTRSNVALARLEFTTNRRDLSNVQENLPGARPRPPVSPGTYKLADSVDDIQEAVFSSMDLPPLFPYRMIGSEAYEDGGVIDNLPIRFGTEIEHCDLLFVLPLNANFNAEVNHSSVVRRLFRVLNVRQGVLERNAFKMIYLYNELAALRERTEKYEAQLAQPTAAAQAASDTVATGNEQNGQETADERALSRQHQTVQVFSICPAPKLLMNTADFWKTNEAGVAFRRMYEATRAELEKFDFTAQPNWIRMAQVSPQGAVTYLEDF